MHHEALQGIVEKIAHFLCRLNTQRKVYQERDGHMVELDFEVEPVGPAAHEYEIKTKPNEYLKHFISPSMYAVTQPDPTSPSLSSRYF